MMLFETLTSKLKGLLSIDNLNSMSEVSTITANQQRSRRVRQRSTNQSLASQLLTKKTQKASSAASRISSSSTSSLSSSGRASPEPLYVQPLLMETIDQLRQLSISEREELESDVKEEQEQRTTTTETEDANESDAMGENLYVASDSYVECLQTGRTAKKPSWEDDSAWHIPPRKRVLSREAPATRNKTRKRSRRHRLLDSPSAEAINSIAAIPEEDSSQRKVWDRLQRSNPIFCPSNAPSCDQDDSSLFVLYRWLRVRLAAGMIRSSLGLLHDMLTKGYEEAMELLEEIQEEDPKNQIFRLLQLRNHLAGVWCIYAHIILELGQQALREQKATDESSETEAVSSSPHRRRQQVSGQRKRPSRDGRPSFEESIDADAAGKKEQVVRRRSVKIAKSNEREANVTSKDIQNHAISIIMAARSCPLVRNHTCIVLSLSRLVVSGCALEASSAESQTERVPCELMDSAITSAIAACWDAMDACHNKEDTQQRFESKGTPDKSMDFISQFDFSNRPTQKEPRISAEEVESSMQSVLELPCRLEEIIESNHTVVCDRNAIRCLCLELNRLSRLGERIQTYPLVPLKASSQGGETLLDQLPLFAAFDSSINETPHPNSKCIDIEYAPGGCSSEKGPVLWQW